MVATALAALAFAFPADPFWTNFVFAEKAPTASGSETTASASFTRIVWETAMADTVARYVTVGAKACLLFATDAWAAKSRNRDDAKSDQEGRGRERERERERDADADPTRRPTRRPRYPPRRPRRRRR